MRLRKYSGNPGTRLAGKLVIWENGDVKTTLEIPDQLFKQAKARAAMEGVKLKDFVTSALSAYLAKPKTNAEGQAKSCPFPLVRGKGGPLLKQMSNQAIAKLEEEDDIERHRRSFGR